MEFSEKLMALRRREGLSQEQLADRLGVTRQSVSKWESGAAMPELVKLISMSELFGVSIDYLVKNQMEELEEVTGCLTETTRLEEKVDDLAKYFRGYAYDSETRLFGLPLVSVRFTRRGFPGRDGVAKGVIAIGNAAVGVVAIGAAGVGVFSLGAFSVGVLSIGALAVGTVSLGAIAVGILAFGSAAVGVYAGGVAAVGQKIAVGIAALGETAVGQDASGQNILLWSDGLTCAQVEAFLREHNPNLWYPLLRKLSFWGTYIH